MVRAGWGIFYTQAFYPGWGGGISHDGFSNTPVFSSTLGGIQPAHGATDRDQPEERYACDEDRKAGAQPCRRREPKPVSDDFRRGSDRRG